MELPLLLHQLVVGYLGTITLTCLAVLLKNWTTFLLFLLNWVLF
jgi:hypothetical protein